MSYSNVIVIYCLKLQTEEIPFACQRFFGYVELKL